MINSPKKIDISLYKKNIKEPQTFFGLGQKIEYCKICTISNQRPVSELEFEHNKLTKKKTIIFDNGICAACQVIEKKNLAVDWDLRKKELKDLCDKHRSKNGEFDCIIPGSGGKDSFYTSYMLKYEFGMNPLTVTWAPHIYTDWGWQNFQKWIHSGFDNFLFTPNGRTHRLLTRLAIDNIFHPFQPFMMGQNLFPIRVAAKQFKIKLVFYGDTNAEFGNPDDFNDSNKPLKYYTKKNFDNIFISGVRYEDLIKKFKISEQDLNSYLPLSEEEFLKSKIKVQYLGYYLPWHPQNCYYFAVEKGGFRPAPERSVGTYSKYSSIDDKMDDFHYYATFTKFGIGRATYDTAQEIRNGEINRKEGINLIKKYDGEYPQRFSKELFEYLSIDKKNFENIYKEFKNPIFDKNYFDNLTDSFRSPHIWQYSNNKWKLRKSIY